MKFQVHSTNIFGLGAKKKKKIAGGNHPLTPNFDSFPKKQLKVGWYFLPANMTGKDDPTLIFSHLVAELSALVGRKNPQAGGPTASVDEG